MPDKAQAEWHNMIIGCRLVLLGALGVSAKSIIIRLAYAASDQLDAISFLAGSTVQIWRDFRLMFTDWLC
jgi:hypothetical protein